MSSSSSRASRALMLAVAVGLAAAPGAALAQDAPPPSAPTTLEGIFTRGNDALFRADYAGAEGSYRELVEAGVDDPDVHFNLAIADARRGEWGRAALDLERVLRLRPTDDVARTTLQSIRDRIGREHAESEGEVQVGGGAPVGEVLFGSMTESAHAVALLLFELLAAAGIAWLLLDRERLARRRTGVSIAAAISGLVALTLGVGLASRRGAFVHGDAAVVVTDGAALREGPSDDAVVRGRAMGGERATILQRSGDRALVRLASGREGWTSGEDVEAIVIDAHAGDAASDDSDS